MRRRWVQIVLGLIFILIALMSVFQDAMLSIFIGGIGLALLWHQYELGKKARAARAAADYRRDDRRWATRDRRAAREQQIGDQIAAAIESTVRTASERGLEAGLQELERHIERAVNPARDSGALQPAEPAAPPRPRARRAHLVELGSDEAYEHAVAAARLAGLELTRTAVIPVDVGLIVGLPDDERAIHRTTPVESDALFVQPFVQLNMPTRAVGRIRYEIIDSDGQALFIHEDHQALERGVNLLMPPARLRAHSGMVRYGDWRLVVSADGVPLLDHHFGWEEDSRTRLRRHLHEDGELTPEARNLLDDEIGGPGMSLDDLLGAQDSGAAQTARR